MYGLGHQPLDLPMKEVRSALDLPVKELKSALSAGTISLRTLQLCMHEARTCRAFAPWLPVPQREPKTLDLEQDPP